MGNFQELKVWQRSKDLAVSIYKLTAKGAFTKDWGLRDQLRRAAVSIPSNIAEGNALDTDKQANRFFHIAKGSSAELLTQLTIAREIGHVPDDDFARASEECQAISKMLTRLIQVRAKNRC